MFYITVLWQISSRKLYLKRNQCGLPGSILVLDLQKRNDETIQKVVMLRNPRHHKYFFTIKGRLTPCIRREHYCSWIIRGSNVSDKTSCTMCGPESRLLWEPQLLTDTPTSVLEWTQMNATGNTLLCACHNRSRWKVRNVSVCQWEWVM